MFHTDQKTLSGDKNSTRPLVITCDNEKGQVILPTEGVFWSGLLEEVILLPYIFFISNAFKVHVFAGREKIVSHSSCRTSALLGYFCPLTLNTR